MPWNSADTAAAVGQFQQQNMNNMAYSGMIGGLMNMPNDPRDAAQSMASGAMNRGMAVGGPMAGVAAGLMGIDPMSMAMRGGALGMRMGGAMGFGALGAGAGALAAGGVAAGGMAGAGFVAHQVFSGAQQQAGFNQNMRGAFNFQSPGGQGFTTGQLGTIGSQIRGMAGEGPLGQMSSFSELSSLAANMGRMGMAQNVKDVQDFGQNFRKMLDTLKTVAKEMGTSLGAAQEFVGGLRGSGIFSQSDQLRSATMMRGATVSGTIAVSEVAAMGNIGSQISRAVGGRGRSGAFAGMKTMGMVGAAIDTGTLNEEDIYNATGLTGAEGRQAYATSQLQSSASFLRTGKGRRFLASVAGENGQLDSNSVNQWMAGGVGTGETMGMAGKNLGKVGRANFIRNEGRLRGAAMEQFGGLLPVMALNQWAESKGIDINSMGDREMLFASRQLGIGMDQLEDTVKQARNLPQLLEQQRKTQESDGFMRQRAERGGRTGVAGTMKSFEKVREHVQGKLQQIGADMYTDLSSYFESWINEKAGLYVEQASKNVTQNWEKAVRGDKSAAATFSTGTSGFRAGAQGAAGKAMGGGGSYYESMSRGGMMGIGGESDLDRLSKAGYGDRVRGIRGKGEAGDVAGADAGIRSLLSDSEKANRAAALGAGGPGFQLKGETLSAIKEAYAFGGIAGKGGADRIMAVQTQLERMAKGGNEDASKLLERFEVGDSVKKFGKAGPLAGKDLIGLSGLVGGIERQAGIGGDAGLAARSQVGPITGFGGQYHTIDAQAEAMGAGMGVAAPDAWWKRGLKGAGAGAAAGLVGMGVMAIPGAVFGGLAGIAKPYVTGEAGAQRQAGQFLMSDDGNRLSGQLLGSNKAEQEAARNDLLDRITSIKALQGRGDVNSEHATRDLKMYSTMAAADEYSKAKEDGGGKISEQDLKRIQSKYRGNVGRALSEGDLEGALESMSQGVQSRRRADRNYMAGSIGTSARGQIDRMIAGGLLDKNAVAGGMVELTSDVKDRVAKAGGAVGSEFATRRMKMLAAGQALGIKGGQAGPELDEYMALQGEEEKRISSLGVKDLKSAAAGAMEMGDYGQAQRLGQRAGDVRRSERSITRRGEVGVAEGLGINLSREDKLALMRGGLSGAGKADQRAAFFASRLGIGGAGELAGAAGAAQEAEKAYNSLAADAPSSEKAAAKNRMDAAKSKLDTAKMNEPLLEKLKALESAKSPEDKAKQLASLKDSPEMMALKQKQDKDKKGDDPVVQGLKAIETKLADLDVLAKINGSINALPAQIGLAITPGAPAVQPGQGGGTGGK